MSKLGAAMKMTCTKCGRTFYDTSVNTERVCLQCRFKEENEMLKYKGLYLHEQELSEEELQHLKYKIHYAKGSKFVEVTEDEAWEIYRYLDLRLKGRNFKDQMRKKGQS